MNKLKIVFIYYEYIISYNHPIKSTFHIVFKF